MTETTRNSAPLKETHPLRASLLVVWSLLIVFGFRLVPVSSWHGALILRILA